MGQISNRHSKYQSNKGFSLLEVLVALIILGVIVLSLSDVLNFAQKSSNRSREHTYAAKISQKFFTELNNIPYPYVFSVDSSSPTFGLNDSYGPVTNQVGTHPYIQIMDDLFNLIQSHNFDRFTVDVRFMIRDLSDLDGDGQTTDLRPYLDADFDNVDDIDPGLEFLDQNGDGDFTDTYGTPEITEQPHTRLKEVTISLFKNDERVYTDVQLISWEKFTGAEGKASGATLTLVVTTPSLNSVVYSLDTPAQQSSYFQGLNKSYTDEIITQRADTTVSLRAIGETTPNSDMEWKLLSSTDATLNNCTADNFGDFDCVLGVVTTNLIEGTNKLYGQSTKDAYYSPWSLVTFVYDISTPTINSNTPAGTVNNLQPMVRAQLSDPPLNPGRDTSGINESVTTLFNGIETLNHTFDPNTNYVTWIDSTTNLPPVLATGTYTMILETGDNAGYKARSTWTLTVDIPFTDGTDPRIDNEQPTGTAPNNIPTISAEVYDSQSGIQINSIQIRLDGNVVVSSTTGNLLSSIEPLPNQDGYTVSYTPTTPLASGLHWVYVTASHWATNPADEITDIEVWSFNVP